MVIESNDFQQAFDHSEQHEDSVHYTSGKVYATAEDSDDELPEIVSGSESEDEAFTDDEAEDLTGC